jgi:tripartite-type tricarboxylate transporter receptor subunit TctC
VAETVPGFNVKNWFGIAAPAGTPPDRIERLQKSIAQALRQPEVATTLAGLGVEPVGDSPVQFGAYIRSETDRWQQLITKNGIKAD